jgi:exopolysaccharide biosynthesis WecB/TagA/CpsF family protein
MKNYESFKTSKKLIAGMPVSDVSYSQLLESIELAIAGRNQLKISYANPHTYSLIKHHPDLLSALKEMDIVLADGIGVVIASHFVRNRIRCRISIGLIAPFLMPLAVQRNWSLFLFGGAKNVVDEAARKLSIAHPGIRIAGTSHGFISEHENRLLVQSINESKADIVLVGMGQPLQERWILSNAEHLRANILFSVGGFLEQTAIRVNYYPEIITKFRLNWLYRLVQNPRRLWKRYLISSLHFVILVGDDVVRTWITSR